MTKERESRRWWVYLFICAVVLMVGIWLCWPRETQVVTFDSIDPSEWDDIILISPSDYTMSPMVGDRLLIDWPYDIIITDALSQTTVIVGPVTVQFSGAAEHD